ncbi:MAG: hypothetical protein R2849_14960 [Thermomicrobiales bacterium]
MWSLSTGTVRQLPTSVRFAVRGRESGVGGGDRHGLLGVGEFVGDDVLEFTAEPGLSLPIAAATARRFAAPGSRSDIDVDDPCAVPERSAGICGDRTEIFRPLAAILGVEPCVAFLDRNDLAIVGELVGDDVFKLSREAGQPFPVA